MVYAVKKNRSQEEYLQVNFTIIIIIIIIIITVHGGLVQMCLSGPAVCVSGSCSFTAKCLSPFIPVTHRPLHPLRLRVPESESVRPDSPPAGHPEVDLNLPPVEGGGHLGPDGALLAAEGRGDADALLARDGV